MDFRRMLEGLWLDWFDAPTPDVEPVGVEPLLLKELRALSQGRDVFGHQNELLPPTLPNEDGVVPVVMENQGCWHLGYRAGLNGDHEGVIYDGANMIERPFDELLYRASVIEAVFGRAWHTAEAPRSLVDSTLGPHLVVASLQAGDVGLPAIWQPEGLLIMAFEPPAPSPELFLWATARAPERFENSLLHPLGPWST